MFNTVEKVFAAKPAIRVFCTIISTVHILFILYDVGQGNRIDAHILPGCIISFTDPNTYY